MAICENCDVEFAPPANNPLRRTCGRACAAKIGWKAAPDRSAAISAAQKKRGPAIVAQNHARWARPGEHEKLSERNRQMWADPDTRRHLSAMIAARNGSPMMRQFYSDMRTAMWRDSEYRQRVTESIRRSHRTEEYRALFSRQLRERWHDPVYREKYIAGIRRVARSEVMRQFQRERMLARWASIRSAKRAVVRPPITDRPLVRPPLPERKGFSMFDKLALPQARPWRRFDLL